MSEFNYLYENERYVLKSAGRRADLVKKGYTETSLRGPRMSHNREIELLRQVVAEIYASCRDNEVNSAAIPPGWLREKFARAAINAVRNFDANEAREIVE